ncbi:GGDEF/EAL domain-containing response regulator [Pseudomonas matsuisoli]|uniref:Diguanylate cyclase n=1 Tax=Pseudomonas matsuisoli TaxID=1515666 RepID=A0A917Q1R6_9PSED|nr:EAL domain-containing protein [Pseudomonas matsuisoli]GGK06235.1 diguanylate cyclase [Pseudomonas matsuisoli]
MEEIETNVTFEQADTRPAVWQVLAVDDDADFQNAMAFALADLELLGAPIELTQAYSYREAAMILGERHDIAVVLLDVVMETEDAGFRLVRTLREVIGNAEARVVMLTGEPGMAPARAVMQECDINDYWTKSELSSERLSTVLTAAFRSYSQLRSMSRARRGLHTIVESSNALFTSKDTRELSAKILTEIAALLEVKTEGIVCVRMEGSDSGQDVLRIISANGRFYRNVGEHVETLDHPVVRDRLKESLRLHQSLRFEDGAVLLFPSLQAGADYACYVATGRTLDDTEMELLRVFSASISHGFYNVSLFSRLEEMAYQDDLLKIPNRNALIRTLDMLLRSDAKNDHALLLIDIDNFSGANTAFGTGYGDFILGLVASRLRDHFPTNVLVARVKDDLFAVVGPTSEVKAAEVVHLFRRQSRPYELGQVYSLSTVTLDLKSFEGDAKVALQGAQLTLKDNKRHGQDRHSVHDARLLAHHAESYRMLLALRDAASAGGIQLEFQPQVELASRRVVGVEALARWRTPEGVSISPARFIPLAEATGYILPLGDLLMRLAMEAAKRLADAGRPDVRVAVNVSSVQMLQPDFLERFNANLQGSEVSASQIEVEITESVAMNSFDAISRQLEGLREMGTTVSIDDFGTGFSSLNYLRHLPADRLKIDRSFIDEIGRVEEAKLIAGAVIEIASRVGMEVIAEGVENLHQLEWLRANACSEVQGYFVAKPMPLEALLDWLARWAVDDGRSVMP